jgi:hypothetical protein
VEVDGVVEGNGVLEAGGVLEGDAVGAVLRDGLALIELVDGAAEPMAEEAVGRAEMLSTISRRCKITPSVSSTENS